MFMHLERGRDDDYGTVGVQISHLYGDNMQRCSRTHFLFYGLEQNKLALAHRLNVWYDLCVCVLLYWCLFVYLFMLISNPNYVPNLRLLHNIVDLFLLYRFFASLAERQPERQRRAVCYSYIDSNGFVNVLFKQWEIHLLECACVRVCRHSTRFQLVSFGWHNDDDDGDNNNNNSSNDVVCVKMKVNEWRNKT